MEQKKITEKRKLERFSVRLKVYLQKTDKLLGYAENLHIDGMMLVSKEPIPEEQVIKIWFGATKKEKRKKRIFVTAFVIWNSFTTSYPRLYYSGLHFIEPGKTTQDKVTKLMNEQSMKKY